jgi:hypothetical protein
MSIDLDTSLLDATTRRFDVVGSLPRARERCTFLREADRNQTRLPIELAGSQSANTFRRSFWSLGTATVDHVTIHRATCFSIRYTTSSIDEASLKLS